MTRWVRKVLAPGEAAITQPVSPALKRPSGSSGQREQQTTRVFCPWTCTQAGRHWQSGKYPWFLGTWTWTWTEVIDSRSRQLARRDSRRQQRLHRLGQIRSSRPCALPLQLCKRDGAAVQPVCRAADAAGRTGHQHESRRVARRPLQGCLFCPWIRFHCQWLWSHPRRRLRILSCSAVLRSARQCSAPCPSIRGMPETRAAIGSQEAEGGKGGGGIPQMSSAQTRLPGLSAAVTRWGPAGTPHCPRAHPRRIPTARRPCCWPGLLCFWLVSAGLACLC